jgi:hypothetical protein
MAKRGTSFAPLVLGIIGAVFGAPAALCNSFCALGAGAKADFMDAVQQGDTAADKTEFYTYLVLWTGILGAVFGLAGGILGKKIPVPSGLIMFAATILSLINLFIIKKANFSSVSSIIAALLFLIGAIVCFTQRKEEIH